MKRLIFSLLVLIITSTSHTQILQYMDSTVVTEYNDGRLWAYKRTEDITVGITNYEAKDDYGKYYQIAIYIYNHGKEPLTFYPENIYSSLTTNKGDSTELEVYTFEKYMKMVKRKQTWAMALTGFATGVNAASAGFSKSYHYGPYGMSVSTHYNPAAATTANMYAQTQIASLNKSMENDRKLISQGYLKTNTIHPNEAIIGYINIKRKKGKSMVVNIPANGNLYSFTWDISKKGKSK